MNAIDFIEKIKNKDKRYISRAISIIEDDRENAKELITQIHKYTGNALRIGITGPPGAGKSTITNEITKIFSSEEKSVGIIAVDPTSPFTGGAILGDRIRMNEIGTLRNVFVRSMATRGSLGGLSNKTNDAADILDAAGYDIIIFETVGVGQSELDIAKTADTSVVVLVPESGDTIQAMKAGLMEIADLFVINKGDRPGADSAVTSVQSIINLRHHDENTFLPEIVKCIASKGKGIDNLIQSIYNHNTFMKNSGKFNSRRKRNYQIRVKGIVEKYISEEIWNNQRKELLERELELITNSTNSPYSAAENIIQHYKSELLSIS